MQATLINGVPVKHTLNVFIKANGAETGPPLGTILGNLGVNSAKFCKEFNDFTKHLPYYFVLKVRILVFETRAYSFFIKSPSSSFILLSLRLDRQYKIKYFDRLHIRLFRCVILRDLLKAAQFHFSWMSVENSFSMLWSTARTLTVNIIMF